MHQRLFVIFDVVGIESQNSEKGRKKLLLLAERELDSVNDIIKPHTYGIPHMHYDHQSRRYC